MTPQILSAYARRADGDSITFDPVPLGQLWKVEAVTFTWDGFPIATHFTSAVLRRGPTGGAVANYPYGDPVGDSTTGRTIAMPISSPIIVYPGQQLFATYGAGANANGFSVELMGTIEEFLLNAAS